MADKKFGIVLDNHFTGNPALMTHQDRVVADTEDVMREAWGSSSKFTVVELPDGISPTITMQQLVDTDEPARHPA